MVVLDTLGELRRHGHGLFGWCPSCGSPSRYWDDVKARRTPRRAAFDIDLAALIRERGDRSLVVHMPPVPCPRWVDAHRNPRDRTGQTYRRAVY